MNCTAIPHGDLAVLLRDGIARRLFAPATSQAAAKHGLTRSVRRSCPRCRYPRKVMCNFRSLHIPCRPTRYPSDYQPKRRRAFYGADVNSDRWL